jgi:hypothetical protein
LVNFPSRIYRTSLRKSNVDLKRHQQRIQELKQTIETQLGQPGTEERKNFWDRFESHIIEELCPGLEYDNDDDAEFHWDYITEDFQHHFYIVDYPFDDAYQEMMAEYQVHESPHNSDDESYEDHEDHESCVLDDYETHIASIKKLNDRAIERHDKILELCWISGFETTL